MRIQSNKTNVDASARERYQLLQAFFLIEIRFPFYINLTTRTSWSTEPPFKTIDIEVKA